MFKNVVNIFRKNCHLWENLVQKFPIPEPRNFAEVPKFSDDIKKPWLNATMKEIKNLINNQNFLVEDIEKDKPVTPCMDVYKVQIQSDGSLDKLKVENCG